jgi:hypothetical protein
LESLGSNHIQWDRKRELKHTLFYRRGRDREGPGEGCKLKYRCLKKGYNRTQKWKIEEDYRVEKYNSISDKS